MNRETSAHQEASAGRRSAGSTLAFERIGSCCSTNAVPGGAPRPRVIRPWFCRRTRPITSLTTWSDSAPTWGSSNSWSSDDLGGRPSGQLAHSDPKVRDRAALDWCDGGTPKGPASPAVSPITLYRCTLSHGLCPNGDALLSTWRLARGRAASRRCRPTGRYPCHVKRTETLSRCAMRRMASPNSPATETTSTLAGSAAGCVSTLSVMNSR